MKKIAFAAALAATTAFAAPAFAATASTTIGADIPAVCTISAPSNVTVDLDPSKVGTVQPLGNVTIQCNNGSGFTASAASSNGGFLAAAHGTSQTTYAYSLNVAGLGDRSLTSTQSINSHTYNIDDYALNPVPTAVGVKITGHTGAAFAGDYRDTITWTITANG